MQHYSTFYLKCKAIKAIYLLYYLRNFKFHKLFSTKFWKPVKNE